MVPRLVLSLRTVERVKMMPCDSAADAAGKGLQVMIALTA